MLGILPLLFALLLLATVDAGPAFEPTAALTMVASLLGWACFSVAVSTGLRRHPALGAGYDHLGQGLAVAVFAWWVLELGWAAASSVRLVLLAPLLALLLVHWWCLDRHGPARAGRVVARARLVLRLRLGILPVLLVVALVDPLNWLLGQLFAVIPAAVVPNLLLALASEVLLLLGLAVVLPVVVVRAWGTRPLPPGRLRERLLATCRRAGVRPGTLRWWPRGPVPFHNAAVVGLLPWGRSIVFSADLLESLDADEVTAVLGHEIGHVRRGHLWWYLVLLIAAGTWSMFAVFALAPPVLERWPSLDPELVELTLLGGTWIAVVGLVFGPLSRAFEAQADLDGAALVGDPRLMARALARIGAASGTPLDAPSFRHGSLAHRIARLEQMDLDPASATWHHRRVMQGRLLLVLLVLMAVVLLVFNRGPGPGLEELEASDERLAAALIEARAVRPAALERWLQAADQRQRRHLAEAVRAHLGAAGAATDPAVLHRLRGLLLPFANLQTGSAGLDLLLDNDLAYALVVGGRLSEDERHLLGRLRERLARRLDELERLAPRLEAALADTIGCAAFTLDDRPAAVVWFERALAALARVEDGNQEPDEAALYRRRLEAARSSEQPLPLEGGGSVAPSHEATPPATGAPSALPSDAV